MPGILLEWGTSWSGVCVCVCVCVCVISSFERGMCCQWAVCQESACHMEATCLQAS